MNRRGFLASLLAGIGAWFAPKPKPVAKDPFILAWERAILREAEMLNDLMESVYTQEIASDLGFLDNHWLDEGKNP